MAKITALLAANRRLAVGEELIQRQQTLLQRMIKSGHNTDMAEGLLREFEKTVEDLRMRRDRLLSDMSQPSGAILGARPAYFEGQAAYSAAD
jgi:hypothetical protein